MSTFWAALALLLPGPKALMLARVLPRNLPRWKKIRLCAPFGRRGFQGPATTSNSTRILEAASGCGTGTRRIFLAFRGVAVWKRPFWSNVVTLAAPIGA